ncbi:flagellar hook-length control protein FliK [Dermatobacter hominis]|uniref:flagellar hook-length control protein FliK n=1 Tax=Dermatobacter hominis TaxID=2884263 RepID=UPI001D12F9C0|nr:flagellar hook-length control protein FliK [Dermatobacter hominis]UDY37185.1 flagellar hook-length control protein FliK [Dermatobacter hominis]
MSAPIAPPVLDAAPRAERRADRRTGGGRPDDGFEATLADADRAFEPRRTTERRSRPEHRDDPGEPADRTTARHERTDGPDHQPRRRAGGSDDRDSTGPAGADHLDREAPVTAPGEATGAEGAASEDDPSTDPAADVGTDDGTDAAALAAATAVAAAGADPTGPSTSGDAAPAGGTTPPAVVDAPGAAVAGATTVAGPTEGAAGPAAPSVAHPGADSPGDPAPITAGDGADATGRGAAADVADAPATGPDGTAPHGTAPDGAAPDGAAPDGTGPAGAAPGPAAPADAVAPAPAAPGLTTAPATRTAAGAPPSAPAPPAAAPVPVPVEDLGRHLAARLHRLDGSRLELQLHPAELGALSVEVHLEDGLTHLHIRAAHGAAVDRIDASLDELRADLRRAGVALGDLDVGSGDPRRAPEHDAVETGRAGAGPTAPAAAVGADPTATTAPRPATRPSGLDVRL